MRDPLIAVGVTGLAVAVSATIGWNVALAVVVLATLTGLAVSGLLRRGPDPAVAPDFSRVGARRAWQDWSTSRNRAGRPRPGLMLRRLPELLAATAGGIWELARHARTTGEPGPFRRRYDAVLRRRPAATGGVPPESPTDRTVPDQEQPEPVTPAGPGDGVQLGRPAHEPTDSKSTDGDRTATAQEKESSMAATTSTTNTRTTGSLGTAGRASVSGLVVDWETSVEARAHPETFVAWLQAQAEAARHASTLVPDLVKQFHGRGPSGHAGVPDEQIDQFAAQFEEARMAESRAYELWAAKYAAYVEAAEAELTHTYGREVLASAHAAHQNRG